MRYFYDGMRHLVCVPYSVENLHLMARDLGIKRHWFHRDHYDLPKRFDPTGRCELVSPRQIIGIIGRMPSTGPRPC